MEKEKKRRQSSVLLFINWIIKSTRKRNKTPEQKNTQTTYRDRTAGKTFQRLQEQKKNQQKNNGSVNVKTRKAKKKEGKQRVAYQ